MSRCDVAGCIRRPLLAIWRGARGGDRSGFYCPPCAADRLAELSTLPAVYELGSLRCMGRLTYTERRELRRWGIERRRRRKLEGVPVA